MTLYRNKSSKRLYMNSEELKPGEESDLEEASEAEIDNFKAMDYIEEVEEDNDEEQASTAESDSGQEDEEGDEITDEEIESEAFLDLLRQLEGVGDQKAKEIAEDWEDFEHFKENVDFKYLRDKGLREDQVNSNMQDLGYDVE